VHWARLVWIQLLSACYGYTQLEPQVAYLKVSYDPAAAKWAEGEGENVVEGSALLRTSGGELRTCAGGTVFLVPATVYAKERMMHLFGNVRGGFRSVDDRIQFVPETPAYQQSARVTKCDAQGAFSFEDLPDGDWFLTTTITWKVSQVLWSDSVVMTTTGGLLMLRVRVSDGDTAKVVLSY
jgi:hypothetical protein